MCPFESRNHYEKSQEDKKKTQSCVPRDKHPLKRTISSCTWLISTEMGFCLLTHTLDLQKKPQNCGVIKKKKKKTYRQTSQETDGPRLLRPSSWRMSEIYRLKVGTIYFLHNLLKIDQYIFA